MSGQIVTLLALGAVVTLLTIGGSIIYLYYFRLWFRTHVAQCSLGLMQIMGMTFRKVSPQIIVNSYIDLCKAGIFVDVPELENAYRNGAHVRRVAQAMVAAKKQGREVGFDDACAIDLDGRDVMKEIGTVVDFKSIAN